MYKQEQGRIDYLQDLTDICFYDTPTDVITVHTLGEGKPAFFGSSWEQTFWVLNQNKFGQYVSKGSKLGVQTGIELTPCWCKRGICVLWLPSGR